MDDRDGEADVGGGDGVAAIIRRAVGQDESARANRVWWDAEAAAYLDEHGSVLGPSRGAAGFVWGAAGLWRRLGAPPPHRRLGRLAVAVERRLHQGGAVVGAGVGQGPGREVLNGAIHRGARRDLVAGSLFPALRHFTARAAPRRGRRTFRACASTGSPGAAGSVACASTVPNTRTRRSTRQ